MKRENRLKKRKHFNYIYKNGESKFSKFLQLVFIKSKVSPFKVGFSVSKKIGKSVVRNKIKRRMREAFFSLSKNVKQNYNYIIVAKEGISEIDFNQIKEEMTSLLIKASVYDEKIV